MKDQSVHVVSNIGQCQFGLSTFQTDGADEQIKAVLLMRKNMFYHESINNLTPADVYFGRGQSILKQRERIKRKTMETRRLQYRKYAA